MSQLPLSHRHRHLRPVERRIACERGREFGCGATALPTAGAMPSPIASRCRREREDASATVFAQTAYASSRRSSGYLVPQPGREQPEHLAGRCSDVPQCLLLTQSGHQLAGLNRPPQQILVCTPSVIATDGLFQVEPVP